MSNFREDKNIYAMISSTIRMYLCTLLGENSVKVIEHYLSKRGMDDYNDIYTNPDNLQQGLELLFGDSSKILIKEIVNMLCDKFSIVLDDHTSIYLSDVIRMIAYKQGLDISKDVQ